ncbi:MAG TPA: L-seryl-tRNA(Sec) selenium transferase [Ktedonobacterales bacterium]|nr:L-seryl-tRNA(Sec) selenium transferase [Ktedonobacterales bacterium]
MRPGAGPRGLPSVDELVRAAERQQWARNAEGAASRDALVRVVRETLAEARDAALQSGDAPGQEALLARVRITLAQQHRPSLRRVINATGVIVNTNLGRAPLGETAMAAVADAARGYTNLEYDLEAGERGSRHVHARALLRELTGAEDALAVNNNAAAVLVALAALAAGREVIVSRGELVEIGGGFRVPDVMRQSGARLIEVGTTNRTRLADYEAAMGEQTALLLAVHPSNFRVVGFTEAPELTELAALAHRHGLPLMYDLGSGALADTAAWGLAHEPTPPESIAAGVDLVCFSGDKLLGGPQAGILVGRRALLERIARHPLMRAVRIDKLTLAALEATLREHRDGRAAVALPIWRAIAQPTAAIRARAEHWAAQARAIGLRAEVVEGESTVGGGSLPGETLPTALCAIKQDGTRVVEVGQLASRLRQGEPPVVARVSRERLLLDPRTVAPEEDEALLAALVVAAAR